MTGIGAASTAFLSLDGGRIGAFTSLEPDAAVAGRLGASFVILVDVWISILFRRRLLGPLGDSGAATYAEEEKWTTSVSINASDFWLAPLRPWIYKISLNLDTWDHFRLTLYKFCRSARRSDSSSFLEYCLLRDITVSLLLCICVYDLDMTKV